MIEQYYLRIKKTAYWSHNRRALFKMDSPTRRLLVVGFLEPVDKNDYSANTQSDWIEEAFTQSFNQLALLKFFLSRCSRPAIHRKEMLF